MTKKIIFVGSNPSNAAKNMVPFTPDTKSGQVLFGWIEKLGLLEHQVPARYRIRIRTSIAPRRTLLQLIETMR